MGMKTPCLGAHSGSLNKTLVTRTCNLGASGDRAPVMFIFIKQWQL